ncbi:MAG: thiol:disulfide interchange protein DsbA/DsbL [Pseudomonadales bacterium]
MLKRFSVLLFALLLPLVACAQETETPVSYQEGTHYQRLDTPFTTRHPGKVVINEFFWYGCGHCFSFEPLVTAFTADLPEGIVFEGSPAMWNARMELHARAYYTAIALGKEAELHEAIFAAINVDRNPLATEDELADFFAKYGVEPEQFAKAFNSFGVSSQVRQADARARSAKIEGTPELVVNGKYRISSRMAGSQAGMLKVALYLAEKEKAAL